jgi:hypothetical protein
VLTGRQGPDSPDAVASSVLIGRSLNPAELRATLPAKRLQALGATLLTLWMYRTKGFRSALAAAERFSAPECDSSRTASASVDTFTVHHIKGIALATYLQRILRLTFGRQQCLVEAVAISAGLARAGIPCEVVVGQLAHWPGVIIVDMERTGVHAWVEVQSEPVNEPGHELESYVPLTRYRVGQKQPA